MRKLWIEEDRGRLRTRVWYRGSQLHQKRLLRGLRLKVCADNHLGDRIDQANQAKGCVQEVACGSTS